MSADILSTLPEETRHKIFKCDGLGLEFSVCNKSFLATSKAFSRLKEIYSNSCAFAALKSDGQVVTWGNAVFGGDSSSVADELASGVQRIYSTSHAFAAVKEDGRVVTWGDADFGGDSSSVADELASGVKCS